MFGTIYDPGSDIGADTVSYASKDPCADDCTNPDAGAHSNAPASAGAYRDAASSSGAYGNATAGRGADSDSGADSGTDSDADFYAAATSGRNANDANNSNHAVPAFWYASPRHFSGRECNRSSRLAIHRVGRARGDLRAGSTDSLYLPGRG